MHPILQISTGVEYRGDPNSTSGALYHSVTTYNEFRRSVLQDKRSVLQDYLAVRLRTDALTYPETDFFCSPHACKLWLVCQRLWQDQNQQAWSLLCYLWEDFEALNLCAEHVVGDRTKYLEESDKCNSERSVHTELYEGHISSLVQKSIQKKITRAKSRLSRAYIYPSTYFSWVYWSWQCVSFLSHK